MKRPEMTVKIVSEREYEKRSEDIVIYAWYESLESCQYCCDDDCHGSCEKAIENEEENAGEMRYYRNLFYPRKQPELPKINIENINLQKVLEMLPEGVKPSDIKFRIGEDHGDMGYYGYYIEIYYTKNFPAEPEQYKKDKAIYDAAWKEYEKKEKIYNMWVRDEEVKKLESQINKLKKQKTFDDF